MPARGLGTRNEGSVDERGKTRRENVKLAVQEQSLEPIIVGGGGTCRMKETCGVEQGGLQKKRCKMIQRVVYWGGGQPQAH